MKPRDAADDRANRGALAVTGRCSDHRSGSGAAADDGG